MGGSYAMSEAELAEELYANILADALCEVPGAMTALHYLHALRATNATSSPNVAPVDTAETGSGPGLRGHAHVAHRTVAGPSSSRNGSWIQTQDLSVRPVSAHARARARALLGLGP